MSRTISTTGNPPDMDGTTVTDNISLSQRIRSAFKFRLGEYFVDTTQGLDYNLIFGHTINTAQVAQVMVDIIRDEGLDEIIEITNVQHRLETETRRFHFSCHVITIHGEFDFDTEI